MRRPRRGHRDRRPAPDGPDGPAGAAAVLGGRGLSPISAAEELAGVVAAERLAILAALIRTTGDWELAQDCVQDAVERALHRWPTEGVPDVPAAWLTTVARRRAIDVLRRRGVERAKLQELIMVEPAPEPASEPADPYGDDRLRLIFTCCHPALPLAGRVALTCKVVAGLTTAEIAHAFLVGEATMAQRLLRARTKITHAGLGYRVPPVHRLPERTAGVLAVLYLIFTTGYDGRRDDLAAEAIRLADLLGVLLPDDREVTALRALLRLQHARRATRTDATGEPVPMAEQDRSRWDHGAIDAAVALLGGPVARPGAYRLQAEIAALHVAPPTADATDWAAVVQRYDALLTLSSSPVVVLNRAVAVAHRDGPEAGLALIADLDQAHYSALPSVRAELLRRSGRSADAIEAYDVAIAAARTDGERRYLRRRLRSLGG